MLLPFSTPRGTDHSPPDVGESCEQEVARHHHREVEERSAQDPLPKEREWLVGGNVVRDKAGDEDDVTGDGHDEESGGLLAPRPVFSRPGGALFSQTGDLPDGEPPRTQSTAAGPPLRPLDDLYPQPAQRTQPAQRSPQEQPEP